MPPVLWAPHSIRWPARLKHRKQRLYIKMIWSSEMVKTVFSSQANIIKNNLKNHFFIFERLFRTENLINKFKFYSVKSWLFLLSTLFSFVLICFVFLIHFIKYSNFFRVIFVLMLVIEFIYRFLKHYFTFVVFSVFFGTSVTFFLLLKNILGPLKT